MKIFIEIILINKVGVLALSCLFIGHPEAIGTRMNYSELFPPQIDL